MNYNFPRTYFGKQKRAFSSPWFSRWSWLPYIESSNSAFCHTCITAYERATLTSSKKEKAFISDGFKNWKKATDKFSMHELSDCHRKAYERETKIKAQVQDVGEVLSAQTIDVKARNRRNLTKIIDATRYLARQGIALRGDGKERDLLRSTLE